jgi:hypothetical protein
MMIAVSIGAAVPTVRGQSLPELTPESRQKLDAVIGAERERLKIPGLGVAIALNGRSPTSRARDSVIWKTVWPWTMRAGSERHRWPSRSRRPR